MAFTFNRIYKKLLLLLIVLGGVSSAKLSKFRSDDDDGLSAESLLFRDKLNLILNAESKEVTLLKNLLDESREERDKSAYSLVRAETPSTPPSTITVPPQDSSASSSVSYLREHGILSKLEENTKRMEKMVVFLVDLRNLLTESLAYQTRQVAVESELVEIREEMEYLRKELHTLKHEKSAGTAVASASPSFENKLNNDQVTIEWLKQSTNELRGQMREISEVCNNATLLKEQMGKYNEKQNGDLAAAEKEIESLKLRQLRQDEQLLEANSNIEDLRKWQVKMGKRLIENESNNNNIHNNPSANYGESTDDENPEENNSIGEEHFITEALRDSVGKPVRHNKRLKAKVHELQTMVQDLLQNNKNHHKRLTKLESSQKYLKSITSALKETLSGAGLGLVANNSNNRIKRNILQEDDITDKHISKRMTSLEKTMQEYILTLENLNDKVGTVEELQESSTQLFRSLESLEKKYDDRVTELQTGVARMESSVSSMQTVNEDLKEQQTQQSSLIQSVKKDLFETKGKLQTNHLRLASIQSQLVKWASEKCSSENTESIQNIRIATLEHAVLDQDS